MTRNRATLEPSASNAVRGDLKVYFWIKGVSTQALFVKIAECETVQDLVEEIAQKMQSAFVNIGPEFLGLWKVSCSFVLAVRLQLPKISRSLSPLTQISRKVWMDLT